MQHADREKCSFIVSKISFCRLFHERKAPWNALSAGLARPEPVRTWGLWPKPAVAMWSPWTVRPTRPSPKTAAPTWRHAPWSCCWPGTGGCTAYDVVLILKRGRHDVKGCTVKLTTERADTDPKVFTRIHMHFTVTGKGVPACRCGAGHRHEPRQILFGQRHAGQNGRDHHRVRSGRGLNAPLSVQRRGAIGKAQTTWATVVITLAAAFIATPTGRGRSAAPAFTASLACRASSSFIWLTIAREAASLGGRRAIWLSR